MNRRLVLAFAAAAACLLAGGARADGPARLVHDFLPGEFEGDLPVAQLTQLGGRLFFVADDLELGRSVWRTDGTAAGTGRVPVPGFDGPGGATIVGRLGQRVLWLAASDGDPNVQGLVAATERGDGAVLHTYVPKDPPRTLGGRLYFQDCDAAACRIWSTDGTAAGTSPVPALAAFQATDQELLAAFAGQWLVFRSRATLLAYDAAQNRILTLLPGGARTAQVHPAGGTLYVVTRQGRWKLWASRPAAPRAVQVFSSNSFNVMGRLGDTLYFATGDGQLWSTTGRRGTTRPYSGMRVDSYGAFSDELGVVGGKALLPMPGYYAGALLQIDEARHTVKQLLSVCNGKYPCLSSWMSKITVLGNQGFEEIDGQLWLSDGSKAGTKRHDVIQETNATTFRVLDGRLLLGGTSRAGKRQLWETDGTAAGTRALTDGTLDRPFQVESAPVPFAGALFVAASQKPVGKQLWRVEDGHAAAVTDLQHLPSGSEPYFAEALAERYVLHSFRLGGTVGVSRDGSTGNLPVTIEGCSPDRAPCPSRRVVVGERLIFAPAGGNELWSTDGTPAGTLRLAEDLVALGPWRDEALSVGFHGELWATDGTLPGTRPVAQLPGLVYPVGPPVEAGPLVYLFREVFGNDPDTLTLELWRTDGTVQGTLRLTAIPHSVQIRPYPDPAVVDGRLFFRFQGVLWTSDGTAAGTEPLPQPPPGGTFALAAGAQLLYAGSGAIDSGEQSLWAIDPQTLTSTLLATGRWISRGAVGTPLGAALGDALFFKRTDEQYVERWWVTEGTSSSTHPLPEPLAGNTTAQFVAAGDRRYFTACEPEHGCELWSTDRLGDDTRLVQDLWPGPRGSDPVILSVAGTRILIAAADPEVGRELWEIDISKIPD